MLWLKERMLYQSVLKAMPYVTPPAELQVFPTTFINARVISVQETMHAQM